MSEATTGRSALKGISAEKLLAEKDLGVKFWAVCPSYNQQHCKRRESNSFSWQKQLLPVPVGHSPFPTSQKKKNHTKVDVFFPLYLITFLSFTKRWQINSDLGFKYTRSLSPENTDEMHRVPWKCIDSVWSLGINSVWLFTCPSSLFFWLHPPTFSSAWGCGSWDTLTAPKIHSIPLSGVPFPGQRSSEQKLSKAELSLGDENVEGDETGKKPLQNRI